MKRSKVKYSHIASIAYCIILASVSLACRIGGIDLLYDQETGKWTEAVTGMDLTYLTGGPENPATTVGGSIEAIANAGEICVVHAETPLCKAVLSGDIEAIEGLSVELQVSDLIYLSEALTESFAGMSAGVSGQP